MRIAIAFLAVAGLWLAGEYWNAGHSLEAITAWFESDAIDDDAPDWGDVADKIGELSKERRVLEDGLPGAAPAVRPEAELPRPSAKPH